MDYVRLGSTGLKVSRICLGTMTYGSKKWREWVLDEEESRPFVRRALELGINFFDTADMYSVGASEEILGRARHGLDLALEHTIFFDAPEWLALLDADGQLPEHVAIDDVANIQYTSVTTGLPKGVMLTHHNVVNNGQFLAQ